jgi:hypothetical protein
MTLEEALAPYKIPLRLEARPMTTETDTHPSWCDSRTYDVDSPLVGDRHHHAQGGDVTLALHDRDETGPQFVATFAQQSPTDAAPTLGLYSDSVGNDRGVGAGFEVRMTREEFIALHAQMGRLLDSVTP